MLVLEGISRDTRIAPADIDEAMLLLPVPHDDEPGDPGARMSFVAVIRFAHSVDGRQFLLKLPELQAGGEEGLKETRCAGKACYRLARTRTLVHVGNDRTIVIGDDRWMEKALSADKPDGPLAERLRRGRPE